MENTEQVSIERTFFETDEENKLAKIVLCYKKPESIFDPVCDSKIPIMSKNALVYIGSTFALLPSDYKVDLTLRFDDMEGYTEEQLLDILRKNFKLEMTARKSSNSDREKLAFSLMAAGVLFFLAMFMVRTLWNDGSVWSELCFYLFDVITTVSFYQAATILIVEHKENKSLIKHLRKRFHAIHFEQAE